MKADFFLLSILLMTVDDECNAVPTTDSAVQFKLLRINPTRITVEDVQRDEDLEYPGNNNEIFQKVDQMWRIYYECLIQKGMEEKKPEIRRLLEGQFTEFQCDICPKPFQDYAELEWKYKSLSPDDHMVKLEHLDLTPEMTLTENKTLKIFNVVHDLAGLYVCYKHRDPVSIFILEVSKNDTLERADTSYVPNKVIKNVSGTDFRIHYKWTQWTECDSCGRVGKKIKYGTCLVSAISANDETDANAQKGSIAHAKLKNRLEVNKTQKLSTKKNFWESKNSTAENQENSSAVLIEKFEYGIPCASPYLSKSLFEAVQKFPAVKAVVKYCLVPCEESEIFEVIDSRGRVVETANNSAGIYSVFQKLPQLPPDIERTSVVAEFGKDIIIQCPGTLLTNTPFTWKIHNKIIFPELVANASKGRFTIDLVNRIHLKKLRLKDSHIYSCWQKDRLTGTVHLNVEKKFKIGFDHHLTLIGTVAIIGTFLFVGSKVLTRELQMRKK